MGPVISKLKGDAYLDGWQRPDVVLPYLLEVHQSSQLIEHDAAYHTTERKLFLIASTSWVSYILHHN